MTDSNANHVRELIDGSGLFDAEWYRQTYADVDLSGIEPLEHFIWLGAGLGRDPSALFSTAGYLRDNPDVAAEGGNPLLHYIAQGLGEGRLVEPSRQAGHWAPAAPRYVPRTKFKPLSNPEARFIAFYLPQFHAIPENDEWWGKGFTEWTNVAPARPSFVGHSQPHVPHDDIGYYDLGDISTQRIQIDLAKSYGVEAFCYYYYSFNGKRLLERPLENFLSSPELDHNFCVCWANENWSRRWDGQDQELLITQDHSMDDDHRVIADLARYFRDPRYVRINGRPLLLIYRPGLLPDMVSTARRWRDWARDNGIGEIFLAYVQSFEKVDPATYGLDAAVEFPPNLASLPDASAYVDFISENFRGHVYDWRALVERSRDYERASYRVFRGVCPGWDNTARRKLSANVLINNAPDLYEEWLQNAIEDTRQRFDRPDERLIFANAWNEWAEGAHLEPDAVNGYAYLEATYRALAREAKARVAIAVHAYYPDVLVALLEYIKRLPRNFKLFVTTAPGAESTVRQQLESCGRPYVLLVSENRGRDVLPFLRILELLVSEGYSYVVKVHTKRSLHRSDGDQWRSELYDAVIGREAYVSSLSRLEADPSLGLLGPDGHLVSMDTYLGANFKTLCRFAMQLGVRPEDILDQGFFAGTMFIARVAALAPILKLKLSDEDFEDETGQVDGTLAHALERLFSLSVKSGGYTVAFSNREKGPVWENSRYDFV